MFIADDILLFPMNGLFFVLKEVHKAAVEEMERAAADLRRQLGELHQALESGAVTEDEFDRRERELLDALDALEGDDEDEDDDEAEPEAAGEGAAGDAGGEL